MSAATCGTVIAEDGPPPDFASHIGATPSARYD